MSGSILCCSIKPFTIVLRCIETWGGGGGAKFYTQKKSFFLGDSSQEKGFFFCKQIHYFY